MATTTDCKRLIDLIVPMNEVRRKGTRVLHTTGQYCLGDGKQMCWDVTNLTSPGLGKKVWVKPSTLRDDYELDVAATAKLNADIDKAERAETFRIAVFEAFFKTAGTIGKVLDRISYKKPSQAPKRFS